MTIKDTNGTALIGFIDIGGVAIPRAGLAKGLDDIDRFERWLDRAKETEEHMNEHDGQIPPFAKALSEADRADLITTLKELGALQMAVAERMEAELQSRGPTPTDAA